MSTTTNGTMITGVLPVLWQMFPMELPTITKPIRPLTDLYKAIFTVCTNLKSRNSMSLKIGMIFGVWSHYAFAKATKYRVV
ncbi:MAG: hypothetical protein R2784_16790 [Saprospiraceae bacterium]